MTAMAWALRAAGLVPPEDKLRDIATDALAKNAGSWDAAKDAVFNAARDDAALLWALFEPYRAIAVQKLLTEVAAQMRAAQAGGGHAAGDNHRSSAPASQQNSRPAETLARRETTGPVGVRQPTQGRPVVSHSTTAGMEAVAAVTRLSLLQTKKFDGRSFGDWHPGELRAWARRTGIDVRFVEIATGNIPADGKVSDWVSADQADSAWKRAMEETNAA